MAVQTVREVMTANPQCCTPAETALAVSRKMAAGNYGAVPVVEPQTHHLVGIITDRDITCRMVAGGMDPTRVPVREGMSQDIASLGPEASIHDCVRLMEERQVRRIPIVDDRGTVLGIVAQADIARAAAHQHELEGEMAKMVEQVSAPQHMLIVGNTGCRTTTGETK